MFKCLTWASKKVVQGSTCSPCGAARPGPKRCPLRLHTWFKSLQRSLLKTFRSIAAILALLHTSKEEKGHRCACLHSHKQYVHATGGLAKLLRSGRGAHSQAPPRDVATAPSIGLLRTWLQKRMTFSDKSRFSGMGPASYNWSFCLWLKSETKIKLNARL